MIGRGIVPLLSKMWYGAVLTELKVNQTFFYDLLNYYPQLHKKFAKITKHQFLKWFTPIILKGIDDGALKDINPEVSLECMIRLYKAKVRKAHFKKLSVTPLDLLLNTIIVYIIGLCTEKGIRQPNEYISTCLPIRKEPNSYEKVTINFSNVS